MNLCGVVCALALARFACGVDAPAAQTAGLPRIVKPKPAATTGAEAGNRVSGTTTKQQPAGKQATKEEAGAAATKTAPSTDKPKRTSGANDTDKPKDKPAAKTAAKPAAQTGVKPSADAQKRNASKVSAGMQSAKAVESGKQAKDEPEPRVRKPAIAGDREGDVKQTDAPTGTDAAAARGAKIAKPKPVTAAAKPNYYLSEDGERDELVPPCSPPAATRQSAGGRANDDLLPDLPPATVASRSFIPAVFRPSTAGQGFSATTVNTDYRTRPANTALPQFVFGRGWNGKNLPIGEEDPYRKSVLTEYTPTDIVLLPRELWYCNQPAWLRREPAEALVRMTNDMASKGLRVYVFSAFRDYNHQARLSRGGGNVARAGKSEHQLGTTVDVTNNSRYLMSRSFGNTPEGSWLARNAPRYGFHLTVMRGSTVVEPWHFRYFGSKTPKRGAAAEADNREASDAETRPKPRGGFSIKKLFGRGDKDN